MKQSFFTSDMGACCCAASKPQLSASEAYEVALRKQYATYWFKTRALHCSRYAKVADAIKDRSERGLAEADIEVPQGSFAEDIAKHFKTMGYVPRWGRRSC